MGGYCDVIRTSSSRCVALKCVSDYVSHSTFNFYASLLQQGHHVLISQKHLHCELLAQLFGLLNEGPSLVSVTWASEQKVLDAVPQAGHLTLTYDPE